MKPLTTVVQLFVTTLAAGVPALLTQLAQLAIRRGRSALAVKYE
jgi:hypothetical protein